MCAFHGHNHNHNNPVAGSGSDARAPVVPARPWYRTPLGAACVLLFAVGVAYLAYMLWTEHRVHAGQLLPLAIFLLCPLMHLFMHRRDGHGAGREASNARFGSGEDAAPTLHARRGRER